MKLLEQALNDIYSYLEDIVLKRPLTEEEKKALSIKIKYWYKLEHQESFVDIEWHNQWIKDFFKL